MAKTAPRFGFTELVSELYGHVSRTMPLLATVLRHRPGFRAFDCHQSIALHFRLFMSLKAEYPFQPVNMYGTSCWSSRVANPVVETLPLTESLPRAYCLPAAA